VEGMGTGKAKKEREMDGMEREGKAERPRRRNRGGKGEVNTGKKRRGDGERLLCSDKFFFKMPATLHFPGWCLQCVCLCVYACYLMHVTQT